MDASALLTAQGWRGAGHTLHATSDSVGLARPLLLERRRENEGLGAQKGYSHATSNQWWMDAFDQQLRGLEMTKTTGTRLTKTVTTTTTTSITTAAPGHEMAEGRNRDGKNKKTRAVKTEDEAVIGVVQTVVDGGLNKIAPKKGPGSLYRSFVSGGLLAGTLVEGIMATPPESEDATEVEGAGSAEAAGPATKDNSREARRRRKAERAARRLERAETRSRKARKAARRAELAMEHISVADEGGNLDTDDAPAPVEDRHQSRRSGEDQTPDERRARKQAKILNGELRKEQRPAKER